MSQSHLFAVAAGATIGAVAASTAFIFQSRKRARTEHEVVGKSTDLLPDTLNRTIPEEIQSAQVQLQKLAREAIDGHGEQNSKDLEPAYHVTLPCRRSLSKAEKEVYNRDGFVICRDWFSADEIAVLKRTVEEDHQIDTQKISVADAEGRSTKLTLWWYLGDDTYGQFGRSASLVQAASDLMGGSEPYHSHTKVLLKEPRSGGAWEWHQDFGYWYSQGLLHPDKIVDAIIAIDENTTENGCMRLVQRSHTMGRIEHGTFGGQAGADPRRVVAAMNLPGHEVIKLKLRPGDVAFMHSNTLHASSPNLSEAWRRNIIVAYNSRHNAPLEGSPDGQPPFNAIDVVGDENIMKIGVRGLIPSLNKMLLPEGVVLPEPKLQ